MNIPGRRLEQNEVVITSPFARGGDGMLLRAQLIDTGATAGNVSVAVLTRNREDSWGATPIETLTVQTTVGTVYELLVDTSKGIKEELRLTITGPSSAGWSLIRIFPPVFYDAAKGTVA